MHKHVIGPKIVSNVVQTNLTKQMALIAFIFRYYKGCHYIGTTHTFYLITMDPTCAQHILRSTKHYSKKSKMQLEGKLVH